MEKYKQVLEESLGEILTSTVQMLPKIILGILGLLVAWILVKIIMFVLKRILKAAKVDRLSQKIAEAKLFGDKEVKVDLIKIILGVTKILLILLFTVVISEVLGIKAISEGIVSIFGYLPTLVSLPLRKPLWPYLIPWELGVQSLSAVHSFILLPFSSP